MAIWCSYMFTHGQTDWQTDRRYRYRCLRCTAWAYLTDCLCCCRGTGTQCPADTVAVANVGRPHCVSLYRYCVCRHNERSDDDDVMFIASCVCVYMCVCTTVTAPPPHPALTPSTIAQLVRSTASQYSYYKPTYTWLTAPFIAFTLTACVCDKTDPVDDCSVLAPRAITRPAVDPILWSNSPAGSMPASTVGWLINELACCWNTQCRATWLVGCRLFYTMVGQLGVCS